MKYTVNKNSNESAYIQLYKQIREDIVNSAYKYGEKLPSKRLLSEEAEVSVITAEHAYSILCDEGYIESRQRSGYYVIYKKSELFPVSQNPMPVSNSFLRHEQNDEEFPFSLFAKTMRSVISKYGEQILVKSQNMGSSELRYAICKYLKRSRGINVTPDRIVIGSGAEYLYGLVVQLLGRERIFGIEDPSYEKIRSVYLANGVTCDMLKMGHDGILTSELMRTKASVLHITPFNSFPSGVTADATKRNEYIEWAKTRNAFIVEDDFDSEFTVSTKYEDTVFSLEPKMRVIYINTFTKTISPSMRLGYMVLPEALTEKFAKKLGFYSCTVPVFDQYVIAEFIESGDFERHINRVRRKRRKSLM